ncbi:MAG: CYTH domain-containing protein [Gammaproteobacteria bacterium]|jgi:adenylate cyclase
MAHEIERKFLVTGDAWRSLADEAIRMRQGYLSEDYDRSIRVRTENDRAFINIKSSVDGIHRLEYEYEIPLTDAEEILDRVALRPLIEKTRHLVHLAGVEWEIDVFEGDNEGLVVAEVELPSADTPVALPEWVGKEVSHDLRYYNVSLQKHPYRSW